MALRDLTSLTMCLLAAACSGSGGAGSSGANCVDYSMVSGSPSFSKDVIPIFQLSCDFSSCHATGGPPQQDTNLGKNTMDGKMSASEIKAVHDNLVNAPAKESTGKRVVAGDPANSFLMQKLEYDALTSANCAAIQCAPSGCGARMPQNGEPLMPQPLNTIAAWIKSGAPDN